AARGEDAQTLHAAAGPGGAAGAAPGRPDSGRSRQASRTIPALAEVVPAGGGNGQFAYGGT
ncbi:MAG: hypothetical protein LIP77_10570, partial [Planctomycetes bacterium]|nr:hypothetical protein [Planctomycetota bacterium]